MNTIIILYIGLAILTLIIVITVAIDRENTLSEELGVENPREIFENERAQYFAGLDECNENYPSKSEEWNSCYEKVKAEVDFRP